jgi:hypothetical protein
VTIVAIAIAGFESVDPEGDAVIVTTLPAGIMLGAV